MFGLIKSLVKDHLYTLKSTKFDTEGFIEDVLAKSRRLQEQYSPFIAINDSANAEGAGGMLYGLPVSVKDNICTRGLQTTAGSRILEGYVPPFDATAVAKVRQVGGIVIGKTAMDEFGFGTFATTCAYGVPKNPFDKDRSCGGSSGGAACVTAAADFPHIALAQSTGGSITAPAAFTGTVGLTPTYGRVSRYGLIDFSNSMDKIGVISRCVYDSALMLSVMSGYDPLDSTSSAMPSQDYTKYMTDSLVGVRIAVPREYFSDVVDRRISERVMDALAQLEDCGATYESVSLATTKYAIAAYYLIAVSEASTNLAKYCGLRYGLHDSIDGNFDAYFSKVRSEGFGEEAKRRIILGTFARLAGFRDAYYLKALKVRTKIIEEFKEVFRKFDVIATPSMPILPPRFSEIERMAPIEKYNVDLLTTAPNMAGVPTLSVPTGTVGGLPSGMQLIADHFREDALVKVGSVCEGLKWK